MEIQDAYNEWSAIYDTDTNKTRDLDQQVTRKALGDLSFNAILETGCGTGKNTGLLAQIGDIVNALDFSPGMLAAARRKVTARNVRFSAADLTTPWPCASHIFDLVVCCLVLEHIQHIGPFFAEASRVLRAGGMFYISELHPFRQYQGIQARFQRGGETIAVPAFVHHISEFTKAAHNQQFTLKQLSEHWHTDDQGGLPRLVTFIYTKPY